MNYKELIERKLRADELAYRLIDAESDKILEVADTADSEICELERRIEDLKTIRAVYRGFAELGLRTRREVGDEVYRYAMELAREGGDGDRLLELLYNAGLDGSEKAVMEYARVLAYGLYGVHPSVAEAVDWLEPYAEAGNAEACYSIAVLHFDFPREVEASVAYDYCQRAASLGYPPAIRRLSLPFDLRSYTEKLLDKAQKGDKRVYYELSGRQDLSEEERKRYLRLALEENDMSAEFDTAKELKTKGRLEEAKELFEKAGLHGCSEAYMELARLAIPADGESYCGYSKLDVTLLPLAYHKTELEYYKKAAELGNAKALFLEGVAYRQGYPVNRNYETAFDCFAKAVELGEDYLAACALAECYEKGLGVEADEKAAVLYYTMSAEAGNAQAMLNLARIFREGLGSIAKDEEKAARYLFMSGVRRD